MEIMFEFEKETKNTVKFDEVTKNGSDPIIGSLYVQKSALVDKSTDSLSLILNLKDKESRPTSEN
jgi:hypothetical protein